MIKIDRESVSICSCKCMNSTESEFDINDWPWNWILSGKKSESRNYWSSDQREDETISSSFFSLFLFSFSGWR